MAADESKGDGGAGAGKIQFCDPHFHWWNSKATPNPNLGEVVATKLPVYTAKEHRASFDGVGVTLTSAVHVETVVGQKAGGFELDPVAETTFVVAQAGTEAAPPEVGIVVYAHLGREDAASVIEAHLKAGAGQVRGVRMIQNHHDTDESLTWPQVERGDFWSDAQFQKGFALLAANNLSFDCQINPHQLKDAAAFFAERPDTPVILNHLGCLKLASDEESAIAEATEVWAAGMQALAAVPHVHVKLSMACYTAPWHTDEAARARMLKLTRQVIEWFGSDRCMFASNYPVDMLFDVSMAQLVAFFQEVVDGMGAKVAADCFHDTACRVYRMEA